MHTKKTVSVVLLLLITFMVSQSIGYAANVFNSMSLGLERDIGHDNYQSITAQKTVVQLPTEEADHLNNLFNHLVSCCNRKKELHFSLTVVKDDSINAFALPAGYVFVNTGLLSFARNDGELAGILGHEIAHIERRHSMKAIYRAVGLSAILSLFLNGTDIKWKEELSEIAGVSMNLVQLGYSRQAEFEADRYGVAIMEKAGYNKQDILNFWQRFRAKYGDGQKTMALFESHPFTGQRIKQIETLP